MNLLDALIGDVMIAPVPLTNGEQRREIWICIRTDGAIGEGSMENPYNGATQPLFDAVMRFVNETSKVQPNMTIRLGPGIFQTLGGDGNGFTGTWRPLEGQRIVGSGMHVTTLRLVNAGTLFSNVSQTIVCSNSPINNFEISDLTLDCNFARQLNLVGNPPINAVMLSAVSIKGRNTRVRRVRVINFGTGSLNHECFPIFVNPAVSDNPAAPDLTNRGNPIIEDCIVELPNDSNARETTCLSAYGDPSVELQGAGAVIRNCYVNCELANPQYPEISVVNQQIAAP